MYYVLQMSRTTYILKDDFESFVAGTTFTTIAVYGDDHIHAAKLEPDNPAMSKRINVTKDQMDTLFVEK